MSLIPSTTSNNDTTSLTPFTPFSQDFWDNFFSHVPFSLLRNSPFPFLSPLPQSTPYSELAVETSGDVRTRLECKEIPEAHLIVAELPGVEKNDVGVAAEDGGFVRISAADGRFSWRLKLPQSANLNSMSYSMENGILTVIVPKFGYNGLVWDDYEGDRDNVRVVEITGSDD